MSPSLAGRFFTIEPPGKPFKADIFDNKQMRRKIVKKRKNIINLAFFSFSKLYALIISVPFSSYLKESSLTSLKKRKHKIKKKN